MKYVVSVDHSAPAEAHPRVPTVNILARCKRAAVVKQATAATVNELDFNNLLTIITAHVQWLADTLQADPRRVHVEAIVNAARRAASVANQFNTFRCSGLVVQEEIDAVSVTAILSGEYDPTACVLRECDDSK